MTETESLSLMGVMAEDAVDVGDVEKSSLLLDESSVCSKVSSGPKQLRTTGR